MRNPICRHCLKPMDFVVEGVTCYLYWCGNNDCEAWHNATEVNKTKLAEKLSSSSLHKK